MPKLKTSRTKKAPEGFESIQSLLEKFNNKLKAAETKSTASSSVKKNEILWEIYQIHHQRSRYIYDLYYKKEIILKPLYDWLLKNKYGDINLIAKWRKQGYENLCCLRCIQTKENNHGSTCICRVPKNDLLEEKKIQCITCGCRGCSSTD
ncbi:hypothetical protein BABINDRAFT_10685 [Babjeviella inositovora NRRL Y-12698]|uniref:G10 protein n=1 Tax=Babjeviella inositovora NRRL Y-12698 TaxID=984486 RepID=A0A1E3QX06_9ASCO|nr:uncharacterized protein BABINDRAFT_10685 [Babjeviella inositovora NRRL Y-12698]ODQ82213.1 hypothetical protein BABINDRAFT_10685 [Babjeviella inositovora NRRL Y-12698]